ncbi:MAG: MFS transporter, partial [Actinobacteria bacterium]|nr:MFS transporter [Actinomycetota bacterium]
MALNREKSSGSAVLMVLAGAQFLMVLDTSVMNVNIADVAKDLHTTITGIQAAITFFALVMASLMITGGTLGSRWGRKPAFRIGLIVYGLGSLITGLSPNLATLLTGWSLLEGAGSALILPAIVALVAANFPAPKRPAVYGAIAAAGAVGIAVGPLIGGLVSTLFSWRWIFISESVIVLIILVLLRSVADAPVTEKPAFDVGGAILSVLGLGLTVFAILRSAEWGWLHPRPAAPQLGALSATLPVMALGLLTLGFLLSYEVRREGLGKPVLISASLL